MTVKMMKRRIPWIRLAWVVLFLTMAAGTAFCAEARLLVATGSWGAISCGHPEAARAAIKILERGGNAVDGAVAAGFALGVADLSNSGCGGEGYALIRLASGPIEAWDGSIRLPKGEIIGSSGIGLPTLPALLLSLLDRHGTKIPGEVMAPAIRLARDGFPVSAYLEQVLSKRIGQWTDPTALGIFAPQGRPLRAGEKLVQPALARTLIQLAADHGESFYRGEGARILADDFVRRNCSYRASDLSTYAPKQGESVSLQIGPWQLIGTPPPSSSIVTMALIRDLLEAGKRTPPVGVLEAGRQALGRKKFELTHFVHDPARYFLPPSKTSRNVIEEGKGEEPPESNTTHLVVWDRHGMIVSMTLTLGTHFGTGELSPLGFFYNSEMNNFGAFSAMYPKDYPPDAGPVSSKSPLLVLRDGKPILAIGGAGNNRIITNVAVVTADLITGQRSLQEAVHAPREFPGEKPEATLEWFPQIASRAAEVRRHAWKYQIKPAGDDFFGLVAAVASQNGTLTAVGDYRRDGAAGALRVNPDDARGYTFELLAWKKSGVTEIGLVEPIVSPRQGTEGWQSADQVPIRLESTGPVTRARMSFGDPSSAVRMVQNVAIYPDRPGIAPTRFESPLAWMEKPSLGPLEQEFFRKMPRDLSQRRLVEWLLVKIGLEMRYRKIPGMQSPEDLLKRGEGDCSGKAQLMVDLLRHRGIPCRRVGGVMLVNGIKEVTHAWLDVWIDGRWVPTCPVNMIFGRLPSNWLIMRYGSAQSLEGANHLLWRIRELKSHGDFPAALEDPGDNEGWRALDGGSLSQVSAH